MQKYGWYLDNNMVKDATQFRVKCTFLMLHKISDGEPSESPELERQQYNLRPIIEYEEETENEIWVDLWPMKGVDEMCAAPIKAKFNKIQGQSEQRMDAKARRKQ